MQRLVFVLGLTWLLTGCPLEGDDGNTGSTGPAGPAGINCWDLNEDRVDDASEDINGDGLWDVNDCSPAVSTGVAQNIGVELNHQHICEALANLGQYPEGCPSATHVIPTGTLTQLGIMYDDGTGLRAVSCNAEPSNGALTLERNSIDQLYYWKLEDAFVADKKVISLDDELDRMSGNSCFDLCGNDPNCIAAFSASRDITIGSSRRIVYDCALFHSSDSVPDFEQKCDDKFQNCAAPDGVLLNSQRWAVLCP